MYKIDGNIYMCDRQKATDLVSLEEENIKAMLYLNAITKSNSVLADYTELGIHHYHVPIDDPINISNGNKLDFKPYYQQIVNIIQHFDLKNLKILIYCDTGIRLAPVAIIIYIIYKYHIINESISKNNAPITPRLMSMIQRKNPDVEFKNMNLVVQQLVVYERDLRKQLKIIENDRRIEEIKKMEVTRKIKENQKEEFG